MSGEPSDSRSRTSLPSHTASLLSARPRSTRRLLLFLLLILTVPFLSGCIEIEFDISIATDGTQTVGTTILLDRIMAIKAPEIAKTLESNGYSVSVEGVGDKVAVRGTRRPVNGQFLLPYPEKFVQGTAVFTPSFLNFFFVRVMSFKATYVLDPAKVDEIFSDLKDNEFFRDFRIPITYKIRFAGPIYETNAHEVRGNEAIWRFTLRGGQEVRLDFLAYKVNYPAVIGLLAFVLVIAVLQISHRSRSSPIRPPIPTPNTQESPLQPQATPVLLSDAISQIERIAALKEKGILTDEEFQTKKSQLLSASPAPIGPARNDHLDAETSPGSPSPTPRRLSGWMPGIAFLLLALATLGGIYLRHLLREDVPEPSLTPPPAEAPQRPQVDRNVSANQIPGPESPLPTTAFEKEPSATVTSGAAVPDDGKVGKSPLGQNAVDEIPPKPTRYVTDSIHLLPPGKVDALNEKLAAFERENSAQVLVWIGSKAPERITLQELGRLAIKRWGVGQRGRDNGAILFVFPESRNMRLALGYGLERAVGNAESARIMAEIVKPSFLKGDYSRGIEEGIDALLNDIRKGGTEGSGMTAAERAAHGSEESGLQPMRVGGEVIEPREISRVQPQYPEAARKARIQGIVVLEAVITKSGSVDSVRVLRPVNPLLDQAAMLAVKGWQYEPATLKGVPVPVYLTVTCTFKLQ